MAELTFPLWAWLIIVVLMLGLGFTTGYNHASGKKRPGSTGRVLPDGQYPASLFLGEEGQGYASIELRWNKNILYIRKDDHERILKERVTAVDRQDRELRTTAVNLALSTAPSKDYLDIYRFLKGETND